MEQPRIVEEECIVYGVVEEVLTQRVTLRISESLIQSVEAAAFEADDADLKDAQRIQQQHQVAVGNVVKVLPTRISLVDKLVLVDVDVEGLLYHKFVEAHIELEIEGIVSTIEANYAIVALDEYIFGKLEISELLEDTDGPKQSRS